MRLTCIGTGTAAPERDRVCSGYLLEHGNASVLFDCGPGVVHSLARLGRDWPRITHVALTHFHNDHTGDLPMLLFALQNGVRPRRTAPLHILGPAGTDARLAHMAAAFGSHLRDPGFPVHVHELTGSASFAAGDVLGLTTHPTPHTAESIAYRAEGDGIAVVYTGDTGYSDQVAAFAAGAALLVIECSLPEGEALETHLTPTRVAVMAAIALPRRLLLTHVYPQLDRATLPARLAAAGWAGTTLVAEDGLTLQLP